jgi:hypothetical protein
MVVYIYYIAASGNFISTQVGSFCQGNRYCTEKAGGTPAHHVENHTCRVTLLQPAVLCQPSLVVYLQPANSPLPSTSRQVVSTLGIQTMLPLPCVPYSLSLLPHSQETHADIAIGRQKSFNRFEVRYHSMAGKLRFTPTWGSGLLV